MSLSRADIEACNRDGYLTGFRLFGMAELHELRGHLDAIPAETLAASASAGDNLPRPLVAMFG